MEKWTIVILILLLVVILYNNNKREEGYRAMTPLEAKEELAKNKDTVLLDVRTPEEYKEKHIEGSKLIPLDTLTNKVGKEIPNKNQKIIVYCRSGNRSKIAVNTLIKMGYKDVYDLGGINSWPYEIKH